MSANMKIDQAGLSAGVTSQSRDDGLSTGALVTLTSTGHISTFRFRLLWVGQHPTPDTTSVSSLAQATSTTYTFSPTAGVFGTWRIELITDEGSINEDRETRTFSIKQSASSIRIPAANERSDPNANLANSSDTSFVDSSENNKVESSGAFVSGTYVSYWKALADTIYNVNSFAASGSAVTGSAGGDLTGSYPNPVVTKIQTVAVSSTAPSTGQVLAYNGSQWAPTTTSSAGSGGADPGAWYLVLSTTASLSNERAFIPGTGLNAVDAGSNNTYTVSINNNVVATISGSTFTGPVSASAGLSGSLQQVGPNLSYLVAGANVSIVSQSNGQIIITASSGGGASTTDGVTNLSNVSGSTSTTALNNLYTRLDFENVNTGSYTFALTDAGKKKRFTLTTTASLPGTGTVAWVTGTVAWVTGTVLYGRQVVSGTALVLITGSNGTVLNNTKFRTAVQHSEFVLHYVGSNQWDLSGDLTT